MSTPSPGTGMADGLPNGTTSNLFARQIAQKASVTKLVDFMLYTTTSSRDNLHHSPVTVVPVDDAISSGTHSIGVIIELIRKNNSDYFEPYLFHTMRNRLIKVQQPLQAQNLDGRDILEQAMQEMAHRLGVVNLGPLLEVMSQRMVHFQALLHFPRSTVRVQLVFDFDFTLLKLFE